MGKKPIVSVTYENERISGFFPIQIKFRMLRNNADARRCSYFDQAWATFDLLGLCTSSTS